MCVLAVGDSEQTRGHDMGTMRSRYRSLPRVVATEGAHMEWHKKQYIGKLRVFSIPGTASIKKLRNHVFYCHICILLINTNPTVYICCIKHEGKAAICVLAVRDDELGVGWREMTLRTHHRSLPRGGTCAGRLWEVTWNGTEHVGTGP